MNTATSTKAELTRVKAKSQVTLPARVRRALSIEEGDMLEATVKDGNVILRPKRVLDRDSIEGGIAEGLADLQAGRLTEPHKNMAEYVAARKQGCME